MMPRSKQYRASQNIHSITSYTPLSFPFSLSDDPVAPHPSIALLGPAHVFPTNFLLALKIISAALSSCFCANAQSPVSTASRMAGKKASPYPDQSCGPKTTCLNCVRLGICFC
jgi:hypothetical protein